MRLEGGSFKRSARQTIQRDERGRSDVYHVREGKSACLHDPRRGVNKYMHKREIDARLGEIGWMRGGKMDHGFVHGVAGSYTNYGKL